LSSDSLNAVTLGLISSFYAILESMRTANYFAMMFDSFQRAYIFIVLIS